MPQNFNFKLVDMALNTNISWARLEYLTDQIGPRLLGSEGYNRAVDWAIKEMDYDGLITHIEPVEDQLWIRGYESLKITSPFLKEIPVSALGRSIGGKIKGSVVVINSLNDLESTDVKDKIVVFNQPWTNYAESVKPRLHGAHHVAQKGGLAALIRSVTNTSLNTLHTGVTIHEPSIPAAAITAEDAMLFDRLQNQGVEITLDLELSAKNAGPIITHNVVGELKGAELPEEVVILGAHLDSWDLGHGAHDDGAGCVIVMEAVRLISLLPDPPKRTIRVVLFADEELGVIGGKAYAEAHKQEIKNIHAAVEADLGAYEFQGFSLEASPDLVENLINSLDPINPILETLGSGAIHPGHSGADIGPLVKLGVPGFGLDTNSDCYWQIHHSSADTLDKVNQNLFQKNVAAMAILAWELANQ